MLFKVEHLVMLDNQPFSTVYLPLSSIDVHIQASNTRSSTAVSRLSSIKSSIMKQELVCSA